MSTPDPRKIANRIVARLNSTFSVNYIDVHRVDCEGIYFSGMHPCTGKQIELGTNNVTAANMVLADLRTLGYTVNKYY